MRIVLLSILLLLSSTSFAKYGWRYRIVYMGYSYSMYSVQVPAAHSFSIAYEPDSRSCIRRWRYSCYKLHYYKDKTYEQVHGELNLTPWRRMRLDISRRFRIQLTTDLHLLSASDKRNEISRHNFYVAPGLGLDFNYRAAYWFPAFIKFRVSGQYNFNIATGGSADHYQVMFSVLTGIDMNATKRWVKKLKGVKESVLLPGRY